MTRNTALVSIIMNCYNCAKYLEEAIDSIYAQSYDNWEIIFWDNCSTDNSALIAKSYDSKLKYFLAKEHTALGRARNLAIKEAKGGYIAFLDSDDETQEANDESKNDESDEAESEDSEESDNDSEDAAPPSPVLKKKGHSKSKNAT